MPKSPPQGGLFIYAGLRFPSIPYPGNRYFGAGSARLPLPLGEVPGGRRGHPLSQLRCQLPRGGSQGISES